VFATYPFIDEAVGRNPRVARNLHMGDYTNLSINLDLSVDLLGDLLGPVCDQLAAIRKQLRERSDEAAKQIVQPLRDAGAPNEVAGPIETALSDRIYDRFLAQAEKQCRAPSLASLIKFGKGELDDVISGLPAGLRELLNDPAIQDAIDTITGGVTGLAGRGGGGGNAKGGGGNGPVHLPGGLSPRADLNSSYQEPQPIDPFGLAAHGLDAGLGTMLLQGVAEVR
jgi:phospholipid/cholesterol/gamma-HCH transport system substrate-binding protein